MNLYKYRSFEDSSKKRTLEIINRQELFFSGIEAFNDPFDGRVFLRFGGKLNEIKAAQVRVQYSMNLKKEEKFEGITMNQAIKLVDGRIDQQYINNLDLSQERLDRMQRLHNSRGVLSLSSKNDNILMWSHYTMNHKGLCFGFNWENLPSIFSKYKKVRYQTHYDDIWSWLHTDEEIVDRIFYSKAIGWQYEDEYRILKDSIGVEKFLPETLKEIIFGCSMDKNNISEVVKECENNGLAPLFYKAELDLESYKINIVQL